MNERSGLVTIHGNPLTLLGKEVAVGDRAPEFTALNNDLDPVKLSAFKGKTCVLASVPSLDTPVCSVETRKFNEMVTQMGQDVVVLTLSMDLPFAQKRWCGANGIERVITLSDHREGEFGTAYGVLIKGLRLLARAVFVIDRGGAVRYTQLVGEATHEPDYEAVLQAVKAVA